MLSCGRYDCVVLIATGCHLGEFKVLDHVIHSQVLSVAVLRKRSPKAVQNKSYLAFKKKKRKKKEG